MGHLSICLAMRVAKEELALWNSNSEVSSGTHLRSDVENVLWGRLPCAKDAFVHSVSKDSILTIDTVSHEGIMEDQGRDPLAWFSSRGVDATLVPRDAVEIAASYAGRDPVSDGPHIVTGPVEVVGSKPGDILKIEFLSLQPRTPFGVVSARHGYGALFDEYPAVDEDPLGDSGLESPGLLSVMCELEGEGTEAQLKLAPGVDSERFISFPFAPFLGMIGVTPNTESRLNSIPPGDYGGNMDVRDLVVGSTLYMPVQVEGAGFFVGDPHFAQGHGEVALTAVEAPLRATVRLSVLTESEARSVVGALSHPFAESDLYWYALGMDRDLNVAMRKSVREALRFLVEVKGVAKPEAYAYLSAAADFVVSQVVDDVKGIHCLIRKKDFRAWV